MRSRTARSLRSNSSCRTLCPGAKGLAPGHPLIECRGPCPEFLRSTSPRIDARLRRRCLRRPTMKSQPAGEILPLMQYPRRVVTGHDGHGTSVVLSDGPPPQHHQMQGAATGADFYEIGNTTRSTPLLASAEARAKPLRQGRAHGVLPHRCRVQ
jgi:hypothetical protein